MLNIYMKYNHMIE